MKGLMSMKIMLIVMLWPSQPDLNLIKNLSEIDRLLNIAPHHHHQSTKRLRHLWCSCSRVSETRYPQAELCCTGRVRVLGPNHAVYFMCRPNGLCLEMKQYVKSGFKVHSISDKNRERQSGVVSEACSKSRGTLCRVEEGK